MTEELKMQMQLALGFCVGCKDQVNHPSEFQQFVIDPLARLCGRDPETMELLVKPKDNQN